LDRVLRISAFLYPICGNWMQTEQRGCFYACDVIQTGLIFSSRQCKEIEEAEETETSHSLSVKIIVSHFYFNEVWGI
jgi:hypothetical protein